MDQTTLTRASDCGTARAGADLEAGRAGLTAWQTGLTHHGLTSSGSDGQFTVGGRRQCHGRRRGERHLAEFEPNYEWNAKITSVYSDWGSCQTGAEARSAAALWYDRRDDLAAGMWEGGRQCVVCCTSSGGGVRPDRWTGRFQLPRLYSLGGEILTFDLSQETEKLCAAQMRMDY